jgi:hypothetical protein
LVCFDKLFEMLLQLFFGKVIDLYAKRIAVMVVILGSDTCTCSPTVALHIVRLKGTTIEISLTALASDFLSSRELIKLLLPTPESPTSPTVREEGGWNSLSFRAWCRNFRMLELSS